MNVLVRQYKRSKCYGYEPPRTNVYEVRAIAYLYNFTDRYCRPFVTSNRKPLESFFNPILHGNEYYYDNSIEAFKEWVKKDNERNIIQKIPLFYDTPNIYIKKYGCFSL